jgi:hypothetical protein
MTGAASWRGKRLLEPSRGVDPAKHLNDAHAVERPLLDRQVNFPPNADLHASGDSFVRYPPRAVPIRPEWWAGGQARRPAASRNGDQEL